MRFTMIQQQISYTRYLFPALMLAALAVASRVMPHAPNFVPVGAIALYAAYVIPSRILAYGIIALSMLISDTIIGFDTPAMRITVYGALLAPILFGHMLSGKEYGPAGFVLRLTGYSVGSSILFYLITNFVVWAEGGMYPHTFIGLLMSYINAIPFYKYSLAADLVFGAAFFGAHGFFGAIVSSNRQTQPVRISSK